MQELEGEIEHRNSRDRTQASRSDRHVAWRRIATAALWLLMRRSGRGDQQIELVCPIDEGFGGLASGLVGWGTLELMQNLVACIHAWTGFMLAQEGDRVGYGADDAAVPQMKRGLQEEGGCLGHTPVNPRRGTEFLERIPHWLHRIRRHAHGGLAIIPLPVPTELRRVPLSLAPPPRTDRDTRSRHACVRDLQKASDPPRFRGHRPGGS